MYIDFEAQQLQLQPEALQDTKLTLKPSIKGHSCSVQLNFLLKQRSSAGISSFEQCVFDELEGGSGNVNNNAHRHMTLQSPFPVRAATARQMLDRRI